MTGKEDGDLRFCALPDSGVAYTVVGEGPPLLLVHGYPTTRRTWRHLLPVLRHHFTCIAPDLAGAGETTWTAATDFGFAGQARRLAALIDALGLDAYSVLAHDTGATIARQLALIDPARVRHLALIGTEIPDHRPPWIELFQKTANPRVTGPFRFLLRRKWFLESSAGFGGVFFDRRLIHGEFYDEMIRPVLASPRRLAGLIHYLKGIDFALVDGLRTRHAGITAPALLIWGAEDTVFPVKDARPMAAQLGNCHGFVVIPRARAFVHEEHPGTVAELVVDFMARGRVFPVD